MARDLRSVGEPEPTKEYVTAVTNLIMDAIHADMHAPYAPAHQIPRDVGSASALHEYIDANYYYAWYVVPNPAGTCSCDDAQEATWFHADACPTQSPLPGWWEADTDTTIATVDTPRYAPGFAWDYILGHAIIANAVDAELQREAREIKAGTLAVAPGEVLIADL